MPFTITNEFGAVFTSSGVTFDLLERGEIDSVTPATGQLGTEIVISGERLLGGGQSVYKVSLGDVNATVVGYSNSTISIVDVGGGAVGVDVDVVIVSNTGAVVTKAGGYQALASASILGLAPQVGHAGTNVTILGSSLLGGGEEIVAVTLAGVPVASIVDDKSDDAIQVIAAASVDAGLGDVVMVSDSGAIITGVNVWTYLEAAEITELIPASGQFGTKVEITGTGLLVGPNEVLSIALCRITSAVDHIRLQHKH